MADDQRADLTNRVDAAQQRNKRVVRALVFPADREQEVRKAYTAEGVEPGKTKTPAEDPFLALGDQGRIIEPPYDLLTLCMMTENNTVMTPCIEAMKVNCDGLGHRFIPRVRLDETTPKEIRDAVDAERVKLENFFAYANIDNSFTDLRKKKRADQEACGNAFWEVIRGPANDVQGFEHVPAYLWRLGRQETTPFGATFKILEMQPDGSVKIVDRVVYKRFRTFALQRAGVRTGNAMTLSSEVVWFKEFGDPRLYDKRTGDVVLDTDKRVVLEKDADKVDGWDPNNAAAEVMHFKIYAPRTPYGMPRYIGNILNIFGARGAEEVNFTTLKSNNIPSMMLMVSNGQLTQATIDRIKEFTENHIQGSDNRSKFLLVEAEASGGTDDLSEDAGNVKVDVKPLTNVQITDAMFVTYRKGASEEVRGVWRLSPIFLGNAADHTRSNAEQSRKLTDEQVFAPERDDFDATMNRLILPAMGILYHRFRSNTPPTTDNTELIKILSDAEKTGGMSSEIARQVLEEVLNRDLPEFPKTFPKDIPFSLLMAQAVKNMADPTQPGQQVTAVKDAEGLPLPDKRVHDPVGYVNDLTDARRKLEEGWKRLLGPGGSAPEPTVVDDGERH